MAYRLTCCFFVTLILSYWVSEALLNFLFCFFPLSALVCLVTQSCLVLHDPMGCSLPGSSVLRIYKAKILKLVAISSSRGSSWPRDWTYIFCISRWIPNPLEALASVLVVFGVWFFFALLQITLFIIYTSLLVFPILPLITFVFSFKSLNLLKCQKFMSPNFIIPRYSYIGFSPGYGHIF